MKLTDNTILITGGTSGIGLGLARRFHAAGNTVVVAGRRADLLARITAEHEGMTSVVLDVTDPDSIHDCLTTVTAEHPDLGVLVNNAGVMLPEDLTDPDHLTVAEATVATNLLGPIRMTAAFLPHLVEHGDAVVMNVSSGLAFVPYPLTPTYSATKAAVHAYTEALRVQVADKGVQVLELIPPAVRTDLMGQRDAEHAMPLEQFLTEVMDVLAAEPDAREVRVKSVDFLRLAESTGRYDQVLAMLSAVH